MKKIKLSDKILKLIVNLIPILSMLVLIPILQNDYVLTAAYILIIAAALLIHYEYEDALFFIFGFVIMFIAEFFFIKTGVETFVRNSLFGIMPLWLPFLWAYSFIVIKRAINILK